MARDDEKKVNDNDNEEGGSGGASGKINFRYKDSFSVGPNDDAVLSPQLAHILALHKDIHKARVDKQKQLRKDRLLLKQQQRNNTARQSIGRGYPGSGMSNMQYHKHPLLSKIRGADPEVIMLPSDNIAETNEDKRNENRNENRNELRYQNAPRFNPKPRPY